MRRILVVACIASCSKGSDGKDSHGSSAPAATTSSAAGGDCTKSVKLCTEIDMAHVDAVCGTKSVKVVPDTVSAGDVAADGCSYKAANNASNVTLSRSCFGGAHGAEMTALAMKDPREKPRNEATLKDVPGLGDEAFITSAPYGLRQLFVRSGTTMITVERPGKLSADAEDAMQKNCLIALSREIAAKY